ncbi:MAG: sugar ABC transporter ATP-binding protein [Anaerolineaceae bacterium]|nr:sugar ABC transporter ATP-binding protein [Anaerolineaceae bacterium]
MFQKVTRMTRITVDHVSKEYKISSLDKPLLAVDDITLQIKSGEGVAILGPSGSGKTTLLRLIAGLESPDSGAVYYEDRSLREIAENERNIGMVFQDYALIPHWEAQRTIGFFLRLRRREGEVPAHVRRVSHITGVGLDHLLGRFPKQLSGGEKQRVAIARAFARDLNILLFDEPFANLDAKFRATARLELRRLLNEFSVTSVIVTHDQHEAASLSERIVLLRDGHIEQIGPYEHLLQDPDNLFVASFIGTPQFNFFQGVVRDGQWRHPLLGNVSLPVRVAEGTPVTVGIRPEHVCLVSEGIPGKVTTVTPYFTERYILAEVTNGAASWQVQLSVDHHIERGEQVHCRFLEDGIYFFHTQKEYRLA